MLTALVVLNFSYHQQSTHPRRTPKRSSDILIHHVLTVRTAINEINLPPGLLSYIFVRVASYSAFQNSNTLPDSITLSLLLGCQYQITPGATTTSHLPASPQPQTAVPTYQTTSLKKSTKSDVGYPP
ncbi:hypothetical protein FPQ18DRAFT_391279 [Pyronema domesticum]|nr:hypothetical protein FPQ18DRAFT_391279 [Pyronema domesticum]